MKKLFSSAILVFLSFGIFVSNLAKNEFSYSYVIYASSSSVIDMVEMYSVKEEFISNYERLVLTVDEKYHRQMVIDNLDNFVTSIASEVKYLDERIVIRVKEGKGGRIEGSLKNNICDSQSANYRIFIFDLIYGNA